MPFTIGAIAAPAIGSLLGGLFNDSDEEKAQKARDQALQEIMGLQTPDLESQKIQLQRLIQAGQLNPEMEGIESLGPSKMEAISTDPRLREAQMSALAKMQEMGHGGLTAQDRADLNKVRMQVATDTHGRDEAILQNMAQRGMSGGGAELAARMMASQAANQNASAEGDRIAAMAQQRALESLMNAGTLGGQIRGQDFDQEAAKAKATDTINQFNTANRQSVLGRNVGARNQAAAQNLAEKQRISDTNVGFSNQEETHNKGLIQQQYQNELQQRQAAANALGGQAQQYQNQANQTQQMYAGIGQAAGQAATAFGTKKTPTAKEEYENTVYKKKLEGLT